MDVVPSQKFHAHEVGDPVDLSVNFTASGLLPEFLFAVKAATGFVPAAAWIYAGRTVGLDPAAPGTVSATVELPASVQAYSGFRREEMGPVPECCWQHS